MMRQLAQRMKGQITGGLKLSKELAYADKWVSHLRHLSVV